MELIGNIIILWAGWSLLDYLDEKGRQIKLRERELKMQAQYRILAEGYEENTWIQEKQNGYSRF